MTETKSKWTLWRVVKIALGVYAAIILVPLVLGIFMARADAERATAIMAYARDLLLVMIFIASFLIVVGIAVLVGQIAALTGVVKFQAGAIGGELRGAVKAVRGAATFIAEAVAAPAIRVLSFFGGAMRFLSEVSLLRRALRRFRKD